MPVRANAILARQAIFPPKERLRKRGAHSFPIVSKDKPESTWIPPCGFSIFRAKNCSSPKYTSGTRKWVVIGRCSSLERKDCITSQAYVFDVVNLICCLEAHFHPWCIACREFNSRTRVTRNYSHRYYIVVLNFNPVNRLFPASMPKHGNWICNHFGVINQFKEGF